MQLSPSNALATVQQKHFVNYLLSVFIDRQIDYDCWPAIHTAEEKMMIIQPKSICCIQSAYCQRHPPSPFQQKIEIRRSQSGSYRFQQPNRDQWENINSPAYWGGNRFISSDSCQVAEKLSSLHHTHLRDPTTERHYRHSFISHPAAQIRTFSTLSASNQ